MNKSHAQPHASRLNSAYSAFFAIILAIILAGCAAQTGAVGAKPTPISAGLPAVPAAIAPQMGAGAAGSATNRPPQPLQIPAAPLGPRPKVLIIATGGTIAGTQDQPGTTGAYRAGSLTAEQIIASVPELPRYAEVESEQFSNVASTAITPAQWIALSRRINKVLSERKDLAGIVVTHGTDRLEETAFFLYLTIRSDKPVVVVGAQHPATGLSPDGPINLLGAVRTAASTAAVGKGVMVVMDDRIISARETRKNYQRVGGFSGGDMGLLGVVASSGVEFFFAPVRKHGSQSEFDLAGVDSVLPRVELTFSYPGGTGVTFDTLPVAVVVATTGFTRAEGTSYQALRRKGVIVATAFPSGDNVTAVGGGEGAPPAGATSATSATSATGANGGRGGAGGAGATGTASGTAAGNAVDQPPLPPQVTVQHLTPQKARILMMVALTKTHDPRELQKIFLQY
jgi:L-asparaginase type II